MDECQTRIIIVDDHPVVLEGLAAGLAQYPGIDIEGTATGADHGRHLIEAGDYDILVADLNLPEVADGLDLIRFASERQPDSKIVVLSYSDKPDDVVAANQAGADAYLVKDINLDEIAEALVIVDKGGRPPLKPELEATLWRKLQDSGPDVLPYDLTEREWRVLRLMTRGATNDEIAGELFLSPRAVRRSNTDIYSKLGVRNRAEAVSRAVSEELFR